MICPECKEQGLKSKVFVGVGSQTLVYCKPFYDEKGNYHNHDGNVTKKYFDCSNGHYWLDKSIGSCWCGWPEDDK